MHVEKKLRKILVQDKLHVEVDAEKKEMTVDLVFDNDDITKVCLNKDSILLALTSAIASLTGDDKEQHNYWIQWLYDWQFWAGLWTRYCWWSFSESGESRQSTRPETSWTICAHSLWQKRPVDWFECCWKNLSISLSNHYEDCVWRCQVCLPLCWWSNSWWCWDVETELADYSKNYLPDVDFKDCCALRLPKSFLAS